MKTTPPPTPQADILEHPRRRHWIESKVRQLRDTLDLLPDLLPEIDQALEEEGRLFRSSRPTAVALATPDAIQMELFRDSAWWIDRPRQGQMFADPRLWAPLADEGP